ncbi:hypothetical protein [Streptomyces sp. MJP52]|uniref:hypothetical protein n=1 Tax=Streptomyces sp. MJP52 TaxID=2940555 RepID=UPI00247642EC|nr:hypothetical protein [Streptomyces sp. MJP52]MDH6226497.1 hypothetical protein [Streptomyces sp. MJP52]
MNAYFGPVDGAPTAVLPTASSAVPPAAFPSAPSSVPSSAPPAASLRRLGPGGVPAPGTVPPFAPLRVPGGRFRAGRPVRAWSRALAAAAAAAAVAALAPGPTAPPSRAALPAAPAAPGGSGDGGAAGRPGGVPPPPGPRVAAPVRLADPAVAGLLRAGDLVDVVAAGPRGRPRVVAREARVARAVTGAAEDTAGGALVVLSVPRRTAVRLLGTAPEDRLSVALRSRP